MEEEEKEVEGAVKKFSYFFLFAPVGLNNPHLDISTVPSGTMQRDERPHNT